MIPVHNRRALLERSLASVLAQTRAADEIVVVDDGSTDGSGELAASFGESVRVLTIPHSGRSAARNAGINASVGEWVSFLDSDDLWEPDKLERQHELVVRRSDLGMVVGHAQVVNAVGAVIPKATAWIRDAQECLVRRGCSPEAVIRRPGIYTSTVTVRRALLVELGAFDEQLAGNEDWDLWLRIAERSVIGATPWPPVARYRVHVDNTDAPTMALGTLRLAERHLETGSLSRRARAMLLVHAARSHATLGHRAQARRVLRAGFRLDPRAATTVGGLRLVLGLGVPRPVRARARRA